MSITYKVHAAIFGAPGNGFGSIPADQVNALSKFDVSPKNAPESECTYFQGNFDSKIVLIRRNLQHKANRRDIRAGSSLGIIVTIQGGGINIEVLQNVAHYLLDIMDRLHSKNEFDLFDVQRKNLFIINSFEDRKLSLEQLLEEIQNDFELRFGASIVDLTNEFVERLIPKNDKEKENKPKVARDNKGKTTLRVTQDDAPILAQLDRIRHDIKVIRNNIIYIYTIIFIAVVIAGILLAKLVF